MQSTSITSKVVLSPKNKRSLRGKRALLAASAATLGGLMLTSASSQGATTHTWVGNFIDPSSGTGGPNGGGVSGTYTPNPAVPGLPLDPYRWTTDANNWTNGAWAPGDN